MSKVDIDTQNTHAASTLEESEVSVEPAHMAAAVEAARKKWASGGEPGVIYGLYDLDNKAEELRLDTDVVKHGLNKQRLAKRHYVVDVQPVLKEGLRWLSERFGQGYVIDGTKKRPVTFEDLKVHVKGGYLHFKVSKHGVVNEQDVAFHPDTHFMRHDSSYKGLIMDAAMVAVANWLSQHLDRYKQLISWTGGELNRVHQPFDDGVEHKHVTRAELQALKNTAGRPVDPHSSRSKATARPPKDPNAGDPARLNNRPSANEPRQFEMTWPGGCSFKGQMEAWRISEITELWVKIQATLALAALRFDDPEHPVVRNLLPDLQEHMARLQALVAGTPDPNPIDMAAILPEPAILEVLLDHVGISLDALEVVILASDRHLTRRHKDWRAALQRLYDLRDRLVAAVAEAKPGWRLRIDSNSVTVGFDPFTDRPLKETMPVYRIELDDGNEGTDLPDPGPEPDPSEPELDPSEEE